MLEQQIIEINAKELTDRVRDKKQSGYRLVAISCTSKDGFEMSYSFDKEFDFVTFRILGDESTELESISQFYSYAFLYENEISELFGVKINNIPIDFEGKLYRIKKETPFKIKTVESPEVTK